MNVRNVVFSLFLVCLLLVMGCAADTDLAGQATGALNDGVVRIPNGKNVFYVDFNQNPPYFQAAQFDGADVKLEVGTSAVIVQTLNTALGVSYPTGVSFAAATENGCAGSAFTWGELNANKVICIREGDVRSGRLYVVKLASAGRRELRYSYLTLRQAPPAARRR